MTQYKLTHIALLCVSIFGLGWAAPRDQQQNQPDPSTESGAYQAARNESDAQTRIKLLDDFAAKYPDSAQMPDAYRDYYTTYFSLEDYPRVIQYADKLVALGDKVDVEARILALVSREVAYSVSCGEPGLQTPDAYLKARDAGRLGLQLIGQWQKSDKVTDDQFGAEKNSFAIIFHGVTEMAESGLAGHTVNCSIAKPVVTGPPPQPYDGRNFDRMIDEIKEQQRQSPRVR